MKANTILSLSRSLCDSIYVPSQGNIHRAWFMVRMADNLTTFMCRLSRNLGASTSWNPLGLSRPVMGLLYLYVMNYDFTIFNPPPPQDRHHPQCIFVFTVSFVLVHDDCVAYSDLKGHRWRDFWYSEFSHYLTKDTVSPLRTPTG
jgi:hypothetical protein